MTPTMMSPRTAVPPPHPRPHPDAGTPPGWCRRHPVWTGLILVFAALLSALVLLLSNLQWLRGPLQRAVSAQLRREFSIGAMQLRWDGQPVLELRDVVLGNLPRASEPRMARLQSVQLRLSWPDLRHGRVFVLRVAVDDADVLLERLRDGRRNWAFGGARQATPRPLPGWVRLDHVSLAYGRVRYVDHQAPMAVTVQVRPLNTQAEARGGRYAIRFDISGQYRGNTFSGHALSGGVLSVQDTGRPFPLRGELTAGGTRVQLEGTIADVAQLSGVDMRLQIRGPTLANLYPFLLLPLPASPPYALQGRLRRDGGRFALDDLGGRIGSTDLRGQGSYVLREPRPLLTVRLSSELLDLSDLGPLIGLETKSRTGRPDTQAAVASRERASRIDRQMRGERVLPSGRFDPERLRAIDADVRLQAQRVRGLGSLPLEGFDATLRLQDAVLQLDPLTLGMAGGTLVSRATLDARQGDLLHSRLQVELRRLQLGRLVPPESPLAKGAGRIDLAATLAGSGNSIADAAARADGRMATAVSEGRISNLVDAASSLALGRVLALLATGDREIALNCGATVFDVQKGQGRSSLFVLDTAQTQVLGTGRFDLAQERFALHLEPKPKVPGLLSLRTPVNLQGSFSRAEVSLEKPPLLARAGAVVALAAVAPAAALLPLIETGPGEDTPCGRVLREVRGAGAGPDKEGAPAAR